MKRLRSFIAAVPAILTASFLLGYIHPLGDAGLFNAPPVTLLMDQSTVPPGVRDVFANKCADCHSLATRTPVYGHFAPGSWLIERDIIRGRAAMNLSVWGNYSVDQQEAFKAKIAHEVRKREMPPLQYLVIHWNARLSPEDLRAIALWAGPAGDQDETGSPAAAGDPARGKLVFEKRCTGCHALNQDRDGPHLAGVYGRQAASVSGFDYSDALKKTHIVWNQETLERWLTDPQTMVPGADMDFYVAKPDERADVIAFLKQQSGK
jgi:cytochrome c